MRNTQNTFSQCSPAPQGLGKLIGWGAVLFALLALTQNAFANEAMTSPFGELAIGAVLLAATAAIICSGKLPRRVLDMILLAVCAYTAAVMIIAVSGHEGDAGHGFWSLTVSLWLSSWLFVDQLSNWPVIAPASKRLVSLAIPLLFGVWLLVFWEILVKGFGVPSVLLPSPSAIGARFASSLPTLWADFQQTFLKAVLIGYALGCGSGFLLALLVDRIPFLKRGLLPIGNLVSALPIIGVAPIMVMWFGFDWPSKAAVVVIMTFFPMLVNTVSGLAASDRIQRDLMRTYAASHAQSLWKMRLPMASPFIFNALKINSTLALIGAIVAEFFGTPIVGMGFRISTEVGRMNVDMVWAEIAVAALAGSAFYAIVTLAERAVAFWHPSIRG